jgi:hypothetical protein
LSDPITGEARPVTRATPDVPNDGAKRNQANGNGDSLAGGQHE